MENNAVDTIQHEEAVLKEEKSEPEADVKCEKEEAVEKWEQEQKVKCGEELKCEEELKVNEEQKTEELKHVEKLKDEEEEEEDDDGQPRYRYTKAQLMEIKALPVSNERPQCLSKRFDSDGVWDPEKWYALHLHPVRSPLHEGLKRDDKTDDRPTLKRRIQDPRERVKEDDLDVVLSPQRRSFGSGCQGSAATSTPPNRRPNSPLENAGSGRRIGSGRIMTRCFERDARVDKERVGERERVSERERDRAGDRERDRAGERERDYKDKRFRRDFVDKRTFGDRRRTDSYAEEEPEWFSAGPSSQFETIELSGFDDKFLEDDKRKSKRSRKRTECTREASGFNGGQAEEQGATIQSSADQEVPHNDDLPEQPPTDFDFNEFFTQDSMSSVFANILTDGPVLVSRFTQWFATNTSPSGSHSGSRRSTPHEELEDLGGPVLLNTATHFKPIRPSDNVDIMELLQRANVDVATLSTNRAQLRENINNGVVLSVEEVEGEMQGMRLDNRDEASPTQQQNGSSNNTPGVLNQCFLSTPTSAPFRSDANMSAFDKLVNSMMASGTLPAQPNVDSEPTRFPFNSTLPQGNVRRRESDPVAPNSTAAGYVVPPQNVGNRLHPSSGISPAHLHRLQESFGSQSSPFAPANVGPEGLTYTSTPRVMRVGQAPPYMSFNIESPLASSPTYVLNSVPGFSNASESVDPNPQISEASSTAPVRNILYQAFTPTSVIRNLYATRDRAREDSSASPGTTDPAAPPSQDGQSSPNPVFEEPALQPRTVRSGSQSSTGIELRSLRPGSAGSRSQHVSPQGPVPTFLSPVYPSTLRPQVPVVRPAPQLHPHMSPRMLAGRMQTHGVRPAFMRGRIFPHHIEHLNPAVFNPPVYPVSAPGCTTPMPFSQNRSTPNRFRHHSNAYPRITYPRTSYPRQRNPLTPPQDGSPDLARWFGSEVLEQPLPSMPTAVISVEELEFSP